MKFALKSKNVLTSLGLSPAIISIEGEKISAISDYDSETNCDVTDYGDLIIMPGLVDTHVHINEPGRAEWEGFETATKSAAAGGITMLVDMPLNSLPVTTTLDSLNKKITSAKDKLYVDCGLYGGVIPGNISELEPLIQNGVLGLKAFMIHSGIDEFPEVQESDLRNALKIISAYNIPLLVHAEIDCGYTKNERYSQNSFKSFLDIRPKEWENVAISLLIDLCREFDCHVHIVHLSSSDSIHQIKNAKEEGLKLTVETCPHYLYFSSDDIPIDDTTFKCTPPIRDSANREMLWEAVRDGVIDFIVSDHSPCDPDLKCIDECNFEKAWGGISSLQLSLSVVWSEARKRGFSIEDVSVLMSTNTSAFAGMEKTKGKIETGFDADLVVFDHEKKFIVDTNKLFHKHKVTPYSGKELTGVVKATYLRGNKIFENDKIVSQPTGQIILNTNNRVTINQQGLSPVNIKN